MNTLKSYKVISFILLPFAGFLGIASLFSLALGVFQGLIFSLTVVYIILTFIFLIKAIYQNKNCNPSLRRWIKVTGFITLFLALNILSGCFVYLYKPLALSNAISDVQNLQKGMPQMDISVMTNIIKGMFYVMIFFATTLIVHYFETIKFLKVYSSAFEKKENQ